MAQKTFEGPMIALVTPLRDGAVDKEDADGHIQQLYDDGFRVIVPIGTTGSGFALTPQQREDMLEVALDCKKELRGLEVICGVMRRTTNDIFEQIDAAKDLPVDAFLVAPPMQEDVDASMISKMFMDIAGTTDKPLIVYNFPGRMVGGFAFDAALIDQINTEVKGQIIGVKDSAAQPVLLTDLVSAYAEGRWSSPKVQYFPGNDAHLAKCFKEMRAAAYGLLIGYISGASNLLPIALAERAIYDAALKGDYDRAEKIQEYLINQVFSPVLWEHAKKFGGEAPILKTMISALHAYPRDVAAGLTQPVGADYIRFGNDAVRINREVDNLLAAR